MIAMGSCALAVWLVQHPYTGIRHDSTLYTLFALAKLHPDTLGGDIFLRFGSQDKYTAFTPLYALAIGSLGLEHAAAFLTFASQAALLVYAWLFARRFMSPPMATLGVALLAVMPGEYGPGDTFHLMEGFLTPRLPAEALVLAALHAALSQRYRAAVACIVVALLLHPIMAIAGAALLVLSLLVPVRPKLALACAGGLLVATLATSVALAPLGRVAGTWLYFVRTTSGYLFVSTWSVNDWSRIAVPLAVLAAGALAAAEPLVRRICAGTLATVASGLAITLLFSDLLHVRIFIGLQAWRWLWLADVIALVLSPVIARDCWKRGDAGRIAVLLLATAWTLRGLVPALYVVPVALACAAVPERWSGHRYWRAVLLGTYLLLGVTLCLDFVDRFSYAPNYEPGGSVLLQQLRMGSRDGMFLAALVIVAWLALHRFKSVPANAVIATITVLAGVALVPASWHSWTYAFYTEGLAAKFAQWRAEIPAHAEVLWPDTPVGAWYLLERQNYWSPHQTAGAIFSQEKAIALGHRTDTIVGALSKSHPRPAAEAHAKPDPAGLTPVSSKLDRAGMAAACADPDLRYIVSWMPVAPTPFPPVTIDATKAHGSLYLYRCADLRS